MKRMRVSQRQITNVLKQRKRERRPPSRRAGRVSEATIYNGKASHGGLGVSKAKRLRSPKGENTTLKR